jgi:hypothetical protein
VSGPRPPKNHRRLRGRREVGAEQGRPIVVTVAAADPIRSRSPPASERCRLAIAPRGSIDGRFRIELGGYVADWLPRGIEPRGVLERMTIPHRDEFAFGERLAVEEKKRAGGEALTTVYGWIAALLAAEFQNIEAALGPIESSPVSQWVFRTIDESAVDHHDVFVSYPRAGSVLSEASPSGKPSKIASKPRRGR